LSNKTMYILVHTPIITSILYNFQEISTSLPTISPYQKADLHLVCTTLEEKAFM